MQTKVLLQNLKNLKILSIVITYLYNCLYLVNWCSNWSLEFNFKKCCVMHYDTRNQEFEYSMKINESERHIRL